MFDTMTLKTLIVAEVILILLVICMLLGLYILKQRALYRALLAEYRKLRETAITSAKATKHNNRQQVAAVAAPQDAVATFFDNVRNEALERYFKFTQATIPRLAPELPFSAKVAALRFIYAEAELEIRTQPTATYGRWMTLERKLAEVVRWIGQEKKDQKPQQNHRLRLLQERVDFLKPFETENVRLQRQLTLSKSRQKKLELSQQENRETIAKLEKLLRTSQRVNFSKKQTPAEQRARYSRQEFFDNIMIAHDKSVGQLDSIANISDQKALLLTKISEELRSSYQGLTPAQQQTLTDTIKALEVDLLKSNHHITNLKRELKQTRENFEQQPLVITAKANISADNQPGPTSDMVNEQAHPAAEVLQIIHTNPAENTPAPDQTVDANAVDGLQRTVVEIQKLRLNNQHQRNIIIELEKELRRLRKEADETDDEAVSRERNRDISRLEGLVKECEYCIETLESEVDLLYTQLQENKLNDEIQDSEAVEPEVLQLHQELESLSNKLEETRKQYQQTSAINRFVTDMMTCNSVESLSRLLIQTIKDFQIVAGFYLRSNMGNAEYYSGNYFNEHEKLLIANQKFDADLSYLNEGIVFSNAHLQLLLKKPPNNDDEQSVLELTMTSILNIAAERLDHLEADHSLEHHETSLGAWITTTKDRLTQLDIHYAYQTDESRNTINNLVHELQRATEIIDMSANARAVFDNAISECHERIGVLLESGKAIEKDFTRLFEDLENIYGIHKTLGAR
jgi:hypothetical protein